MLTVGVENNAWVWMCDNNMFICVDACVCSEFALTMNLVVLSQHCDCKPYNLNHAQQTIMLNIRLSIDPHIAESMQASL